MGLLFYFQFLLFISLQKNITQTHIAQNYDRSAVLMYYEISISQIAIIGKNLHFICQISSQLFTTCICIAIFSHTCLNHFFELSLTKDTIEQPIQPTVGSFLAYYASRKQSAIPVDVESMLQFATRIVFLEAVLKSCTQHLMVFHADSFWMPEFVQKSYLLQLCCE